MCHTRIKHSFFQAAVVSILLYGCTTWTLTKRMEKKLDGNNTRMLWAILNKSWSQHPRKHQLYGHPSRKLSRLDEPGHCWRSRDELISDVLLWTPSHGQAKAGRPAQTYIQQLCVDTECSPEDLPEKMNDREGWRYPCWWHKTIYIYIYIYIWEMYFYFMLITNFNFGRVKKPKWSNYIYIYIYIWISVNIYIYIYL